MIAKKLFIFYIMLLVPFGILILSIKYNYIDNSSFIFLLITYMFIYRPLISGIRLVQSKKIKKEDFWKRGRQSNAHPSPDFGKPKSPSPSRGEG